MRKSIKAVLLSALIFPGAGHFSLKRNVRGAVLMGISLFCVVWLITTIINISQGLKAKIESGEIPYDISKITEMATEQLSAGGDKVITIATVVIIICWVFGVVDSYRIGRLEDQKAQLKA